MGLDYTWLGTDSSDPNDWNDAKNWEVAGATATVPPGPSDTVMIGPGSGLITVTGTGILESASLALAGSTDLGTASQAGAFDTSALSVSGVLTLDGSITDSGAATFASGTTLDGGATSVQGTATFSGPFTLDGDLDLSGANSLGGTVSGAGTLALVGGTTTIASGASLKVLNWTVSGSGTSVALGENLTYGGAFSAGSGATLNLSGGNLTLSGTASFKGATTTGSHELRVKGPTSVSGLTIGGTTIFDNTNTLTESGGAVTVGDGGGDIAELINASTGTYDITDNSGIGRGSSTSSHIYNAGTFEKTSTSGTSIIKANFVDVGTVACAGGDLEFDGPHNSLSGTYIGPGMIDYGPDGVSTLANLAFTESACGTNFGVVDVDGLVTIANGTTIKNESGATWNFVGDFGLTLALGSTYPSFTNFGAMVKTAGTGTSVVAIDVTSTGTVRASTGTLAFDGGTNSFAGAFEGAGEVAFTGGDTTIASGATATVASLSATGAKTKITLDENLTYAHAFSAGSGATLILSGGNLTLTGTASFNGATTTGSHELYTKGTTSVSGLTIGGTTIFDNTSTLTESGGTLTVGDEGGDIAELINAPTGIYAITDNSGIGRGSSDSSEIVNRGLFEKTGTGTSAVAPSLLNAGTTEVSSGTLDFQGAVTGAGTNTISGASTLEFDSTLAAAQMIDFSGSGETLDLTDPLGYAGSHIGGFAAGDAVDLLGSWSLVGFSENSAGTLGTLTLTNGTNHIALNFVGITQNSFTFGGTTSNTIIGM